MHSCHIWSVCVHRPNLYLSVHMKSGSVYKDVRSQMVQSGNTLDFEGPTIVYCPTRKAAEEVQNNVKSQYIPCLLPQQ